MKKEEIKTEYFCDFCGKQCIPIKQLNIPMRYSGELVYEIRLNPQAYIPYATSDGDVCVDCLYKALEIALNKVGNCDGFGVNGVL